MTDGRPRWKWQEQKLHMWTYQKIKGMSRGRWFRMLEIQDYKCALCDKPLREGHQGAVLDHDHATGQPRGVLCMPCNKSTVLKDTTDTSGLDPSSRIARYIAGTLLPSSARPKEPDHVEPTQRPREDPPDSSER